MKLSQELCRNIINKLREQGKLTSAEYEKLRWAALEPDCNKFPEEIHAIYQNKIKSYLQAVNFMLLAHLIKTQGMDQTTANLIADNYAINYAYLALIEAQQEPALIVFVLANLFTNNEGFPLGFFSHALMLQTFPIQEHTKIQHKLFNAMQKLIFQDLIVAWLLYQDLGIEGFIALTETNPKLISPLLFNAFNAHAQILQHQEIIRKDDDFEFIEAKEQKAARPSHDESLTEVLKQNLELFIELISNLSAHAFQIGQREYQNYLESIDQLSAAHQQVKNLFSPKLNDIQCDLLDQDNFHDYIEWILHRYTEVVKTKETRDVVILKNLALMEYHHKICGSAILQPALIFLNIKPKEAIATIKQKIDDEVAQKRQQLQAEVKRATGLIDEHKHNIDLAQQDLTQREQKFHTAVISTQVNLHSQVSQIKEQIRRQCAPRFHLGINAGITSSSNSPLALDVQQVAFTKPGVQKLDANVLMDQLAKSKAL